MEVREGVPVHQLCFSCEAARVRTHLVGLVPWATAASKHSRKGGVQDVTGSMVLRGGNRRKSLKHTRLVHTASLPMGSLRTARTPAMAPERLRSQGMHPK